MKRWIRARKYNKRKAVRASLDYDVYDDYAWNGIVEVEDIMRFSSLNAEQAAKLVDYIYEEALDSGYETKLEFLEGHDFDEMYEEAVMKGWISASTRVTAKRDIEKKIRDYIATWAKDDAKKGEAVATYREFEDEMKAEGFKADRNGYDYYITCYNGACKDVKGSTKITASEENWPSEDEWYEVDDEEFEEMWSQYLSDPEDEVNEELQILPEPSVRGNMGALFIYDESEEDRQGDDEWSIDWGDYMDWQVEAAASSRNAKEYKAKYRAKMKEICGL